MTLTIGQVEEVARERCSCGEYQYTPKTWKAIHSVGITAHLPKRLGGCHTPEAALSKAVQQGATAMDEKVEAADAKWLPPTQEEKRMEAPRVETAAAHSPAVESNGATKHRRPGLERYAVTTGEGTRAIWMADGKVRAVEFAWAAHVNYGTAMKALARLGEKALHGEWPLRVGEARRLVGKPVQLLTREQADALVKEIAKMEAAFQSGVSGRKVHSRNRNRGVEHLAMSYVEGGTKPARKPQRRAQPVIRPPTVVQAGEPVVPVYDGFVPWSQLILAAMRRRPGAKDRARIEKTYGAEVLSFIPALRTPKGRSVLGLTLAVAKQMNESPTSPHWHKVTFMSAEGAERGQPRPDVRPEKPRQRAVEPAGRAQPPPPSVEVEWLKRALLLNPTALKQALESAGVKRLSYEKGGRFTMDVGVSL